MGKCSKCSKRASFNTKGLKARFCSDHKEVGMVNVVSKTCDYEGCDIIPNYNTKGLKKARFCSDHKQVGMVDVMNKTCDYEGCDKQPCYNTKGLKKPRFCSLHKEVGMVNVVSKTCDYEGCDKQPCYNTKGLKKARFCLLHKEVGMVNVVSKTCDYEGCDVLPCYNTKGLKNPRFCLLHKEVGMVDVKSKTCDFDGCDKQPSYNMKGKKARFCLLHKEVGMVNVVSKTCDYEGCDKQPNYNTKGKKARFCLLHKEVGMVDVKHKTCDYDGCDVRPRYGKPGIKASHCARHRKPGMIRRPTAKCLICKEKAIYGTNYIPRHCELHKTEEDQNYIEMSCVSCQLPMILDVDGRCEYCNPVKFQTARLAKQNALTNYLDGRGYKGNSTDTIVNGGECGKERPDRVYEFPDKIIILECDEHQHRDRQCLCEQTRMVNIGQSYGGLPVYFLRWNPDDYQPASDRKNPELVAKRHKLVADLLRDIINGRYKLPNNALVSALYLYYDNWNSIETEEWHILTSFANT
jgi:putative hemolysin